MNALANALAVGLLLIGVAAAWVALAVAIWPAEAIDTGSIVCLP